MGALGDVAVVVGLIVDFITDLVRDAATMTNGHRNIHNLNLIYRIQFAFNMDVERILTCLSLSKGIWSTIMPRSRLETAIKPRLVQHLLILSTAIK